MAKSIIFLGFLFLAIHSLPPAAGHGYSYIQKACERAHRYDATIDTTFCVCALQAVPESYTTEIPGLLKITTVLAARNMSYTASVIGRMKTIACDQNTIQALQACLDTFVIATTTMTQATGTCNSGDYTSLRSGFESIRDKWAISKCQEGLKNTPVLNEELNNVQQFVAMSKAFVHFVTKKRKMHGGKSFLPIFG